MKALDEAKVYHDGDSMYVRIVNKETGGSKDNDAVNEGGEGGDEDLKE